MKVQSTGFWLLLGISLTVATEFLENQMFVFAASHIQGGIHATPSEFSMITLAYAVTAIAMIFTQGHWVLLWGYRNYLMIALLLFIVGAVLCAVSENAWQMGMARLIQGIGGGTLFTTTRVLVHTQLKPKHKATGMRYFMLGIFTFSAIGPWLTGIAVEDWGWRTVFLLPIPVALMGFFLLWLNMPRRHGREKEVVPEDIPLGSVGLVVLGVFAVELALTKLRYDFFSNFGDLALLLVIGFPLMLVFMRNQTRHHRPLLRVHELGNSTYLTGLFFYFFYYFLTNANGYVFPIFVERALGFSFSSAGLLMTVSSIIGLIVLMIYMHYAGRFPRKRPFMLVALVFLITYGFGMSMLPPAADFMTVTVLTTIRSLFNTLLIIPLAGLTFRELTEDMFAHGYQTKNILRQLSNTLAVSTSAIMLENREVTHFSRLAESVNNFNPAWHEFQGWMAQVWGHADPVRSLAMIQAEIQRQSLLMSCEDLFRWQVFGAILVGVLLLLQKRLK